MLLIRCAECKRHVKGEATGRLIWTVCPECREAGRVQAAQLEELRLDDLAGAARWTRAEKSGELHTPTPFAFTPAPECATRRAA